MLFDFRKILFRFYSTFRIPISIFRPSKFRFRFYPNSNIFISMLFDPQHILFRLYSEFQNFYVGFIRLSKPRFRLIRRPISNLSDFQNSGFDVIRIPKTLFRLYFIFKIPIMIVSGFHTLLFPFYSTFEIVIPILSDPRTSDSDVIRLPNSLFWRYAIFEIPISVFIRLPTCSISILFDFQNPYFIRLELQYPDVVANRIPKFLFRFHSVFANPVSMLFGFR